MPLIATAGAIDANSYCTVARAKVILSERLDGDDWIAAPQLQQEQSLIWATRLINAQIRWHWQSTTLTQALWWPVLGATDRQGTVISSTIIPSFLERATAIYALYLWEGWRSAAEGGNAGDLKRLDLGPVNMEFVQPSTDWRLGTMPQEVRDELWWYGRVPGTGFIPVVRV